MLFICQTNPYLRVYNPATESFALFIGGKLELDEDHPDYEVVKAEALRNPAIVMLTEAVQCHLCGEPFTGKAAKAQLGKHRKDVHFGEWVAEKQAEQDEVIRAEVKSRAPHACDLCPRAQEFPDEASLVLHVRAVHTNVSDEDLSGGSSGGAGEAEPAEPPAAKAK